MQSFVANVRNRSAQKRVRRAAPRPGAPPRVEVMPERPAACDACGASTAGDALCPSCRGRMALPLVDPREARRAADRYRRMQREEAEAPAAAEEPRGGSAMTRSGRLDRRRGPERRETVVISMASAEARAGELMPLPLEWGGLLLRRADGSGYMVSAGGPGYVTARILGAGGVPTGEWTREFAESFVKDRPEVALSAGCPEAVRALLFAD